jgi:hypothetical protein
MYVMKKSISIAAIAACLAVGSAFTTRLQIQQWNVDHPAVGEPGLYFNTMNSIKNIYCPGLNNEECAYLAGSPGTIIKKP